jgi:hypothetical protein
MSDFLANFVNTPSKTGLSFIDDKSSVLPQDYSLAPPKLVPDRPLPSSEPTVFQLKKDKCLRVKVRIRGQAEEEIIIEPMKRSAMTFLNKSVIFYGGSGTGKTFTIYYFMHLMKELFPVVFIFAPTNDEKHDFDDIVPTPLIYSEFGLDDIKKVYLRQKAATNIYNMANNLKVLHSLFHRVASSKARLVYRKMVALRQKVLDQIPLTYTSEAMRRSKTKDVLELFKFKFIKFYKRVFCPHIKQLLTKSLTQEEKFAIRYVNFNPRALAVFDDSTVEILNLIKEGKKKVKGMTSANGEHIKNFFFKGRWANITHWYAFHDDAGLDTGIRKNAFYSIFCGPQVALGFFSRANNGLTPADRKRAEAVIATVFDETKAPPKTKLVYSRDENKFYYLNPDDVGSFRMCSQKVWDYCKKIQSSDKLNDANNPFMSRFTEKINF